MSTSPRLSIVNGSTARYPEGGRHFSVRLQYMLALRDLGVDWHWFELLFSDGDPADDRRKAERFLSTLDRFGLSDRSTVLVQGEYHPHELDIDFNNGLSRSGVDARSYLHGSDAQLGFCCVLREPAISALSHPVLIDLDPGHIHLSAGDHDLSLDKYASRFTVGLHLNEPDSLVPTLGLDWTPFWPLVHLPSWPTAPGPGSPPRVTTVTQWTWGGELPYEDGLVSTSKRDAYLPYLDVPARLGIPFEIAANIGSPPGSPDHRLLERHGWSVAAPHEVARTPALYRDYIRGSFAEFSCAKPVFVALKTGWFSDRSAAYLAAGRPVVAQDTGFSAHTEQGMGLLAFDDEDGAVARFREVLGDYDAHSRAARALAEDLFDAERNMSFIIRNM